MGLKLRRNNVVVMSLGGNCPSRCFASKDFIINSLDFRNADLSLFQIRAFALLIDLALDAIMLA
jgi:hypothetical protein